MSSSVKISATRDLVRIALCASLIAVCAWICVPSAIPFTMQTFGVFFSLMFLGGRRGTIAIAVYAFIGCIGIPVFSGFQGGAGVLFGPTGGYIIGFLFTALLYWLLTFLFGNATAVQIVSLLIGLIACYAFGTIWYLLIYSRGSGSMGLAALLSLCVVPYILPDIIKLILAVFLGKKLKRLAA